LLKVSTVKVGGSPVYYLPEQTSMLQDFSKYLPNKEKEAYELLKEKKVLRDAAQEPAIKVALRNMKDFAWPLNATINNNKELFWKWYLTENEDAVGLIKGIMGVKEEPKQKKVEEREKEIKQETGRKEETKHEEPRKSEEKPIKTTEDGFLTAILGYFSKNNIKVLNKEVIKKNSEIDFNVELQSAVGYLRYYCKAKAKKRINDGDLSAAYVQGHLRKLPVLFLSYGEPTKRAKEMLNKEFQNIVFKKI
jgi:hypothetical protein